MQKKSNAKLLFLTGIIGNILDHYDTALYIYMAPFLSTLFFPSHNPLTALIKAHAVTSIGILARPLGAFLFGRLSIKYRSTNLLAVTLCGVAVCTFFIGLIPSYEIIGIFAPVLLITIRFIQGIFAAGEYTISSLFVFEQTKHRNLYGKSSSYFICSTMSGVMLASFAATIVSNSNNPLFYWRIAFLIGLFTALFGLILRMIVIKESAAPKIPRPYDKVRTISFFFDNKYKIFRIIVLSSFSFLTFSLPFIFLNNFIPLITDITRSELLTHNTILLLVDIALLPIAGILVDKFNHIKWMIFFAVPLTLTVIPIFYFLPFLSLLQITIIKLWIIIPGVAFAVPLNVLLFKMIKGREKFLITGLGYAIGTEILGRSTTAIGLSLWQFTKNPIAPAYYITFICALTCIILINELKTEEKERKLLVIS